MMKTLILFTLCFIVGAFVFDSHEPNKGKIYRGYIQDFRCGKILMGSCFFTMKTSLYSDKIYKLRTDKMTAKFILDRLSEYSNTKIKVELEYKPKTDNWDLNDEIIRISQYDVIKELVE